jgi:hypothetical protein
LRERDSDAIRESGDAFEGEVIAAADVEEVEGVGFDPAEFVKEGVVAGFNLNVGRGRREGETFRTGEHFRAREGAPFGDVIHAVIAGVFVGPGISGDGEDGGGVFGRLPFAGELGRDSGGRNVDDVRGKRWFGRDFGRGGGFRRFCPPQAAMASVAAASRIRRTNRFIM